MISLRHIFLFQLLYFTAPNILLILPPLSLFHNICVPIFILILPSLSLFLFESSYQLAAPNLSQFMARHSTLIHLPQKYLSHGHSSISGWSPFTPKSSCQTHCQLVKRRLDSSVTNAGVMILGVTKNPSLHMFDIAFLIHIPIPNQRIKIRQSTNVSSFFRYLSLSILGKEDSCFWQWHIWNGWCISI